MFSWVIGLAASALHHRAISPAQKHVSWQNKFTSSAIEKPQGTYALKLAQCLTKECICPLSICVLETEHQCGEERGGSLKGGAYWDLADSLRVHIRCIKVGLPELWFSSQKRPFVLFDPMSGHVIFLSFPYAATIAEPAVRSLTIANMSLGPDFRCIELWAQ